jgi:hypothetical protein
MAANTSFKVQCPSCEAMVPIRDPNLVGKKIDCPKCKYRFVVEDPEGTDGDPVAAAPAKGKGKAKPAGKKGGNNVLILGSVLGGIALIVLGVGLYMLIAGGGDSNASKPVVPPVTSTTPAVSVPAPSAAAPAPAAETTAAAANTAPTPAAAAAAPQAPAAEALDPGVQTQVGEVSNLLPNDTQAVISINVDRLRNSTLGQQAFETPFGFRPDTFKNGFGLGIEEIAWLLRGENFGQNWSFNVIKMHRDVTLADFAGPLGLKKGAKSPIQGRNYFVIAPNPLLDHLSTILQSEIESREARGGGRKKESSGPLTLVLLDSKTVVVAQEDAMQEFLQANAEPRKLSKIAGDAGSTAPGGAPGGLPAPGERGGRAGGAAGGGEAGEGPQYTDRNAYLTIEPSLKAMLDRLETDKDNLVLTMAQRLQSDPAIVDRVREATGFRQLEVNGMNVLGVALLQLNNEKCKGEVGVDFFREQTAKDLEEALKAALPGAGHVLSLYLGGLPIDVDGASGGGGGTTAASEGGLATAGPGRGAPGGAPGGRPAGSTGGGSGDAKSTIKLERKGRTLVLNVDLSLNEKAYDRVYALAQGVVMRARGMVDMSGGQPRLYELAAAGTKYRNEAVAKEKKPANTYPRGTFPREDSQGRLSRTWPPNQRVSWMAGMLPFLGYQEIYDDIRLQDSWRSEMNVKQGSVLVPAFLDPRYPRPSWRAHPPSLGVTRDLGATHFVGVAGVGSDAGDYSASDPSVAKKLGVFGYERRTNAKDITDGLSNTIFMIQVPPTHQRPWIAGGGATVVGIPESRSIAPFVVTEGGKRGAHVLMCDGSVRFIRDDVSDDVMKALCTIKGGEEIADVNSVAPKVDPPKGPALKTAASAKAGGE